MSNYDRVRITGVFCCESELHIGSSLEGFKEIERTNSKGDKVEVAPVDYADICLDHRGFPYLPSTSLRGFFTAQLKAMQVDESLFDELFGYSPIARAERDDEKDIGQMGRLRVYDAHLPPVEEMTQADVMVRSHVRLDAVTGTAAAHALFSQRVVPKGTRFEYLIELDQPSKQAVDTIVLLLSSLTGEGSQRLGKGQSKGLGRLSHPGQPTIEILTPRSLCDWLLTDTSEPLSYSGSTDPVDRANLTPLLPNQLVMSLYPQSPLLIHDGVHGHEYSMDKKRDVLAMRQNGLAVIPGSTIKGAVRAHCQKIMLSLLYAEGGIEDEVGTVEQKWVENELATIFGSTDNGRGCLLFDDAIETLERDGKPALVHQQYFNAIDRFTGGAADGALFSAEACFPEKLATKVTLAKPIGSIPDWVKGLFVYLCRDAIEGDFSFGWGKSKGYGAVNVLFDNVAMLESWSDIDRLASAPEWLTEDNLEQWACALYQHIQNSPLMAAQAQEA